MSSIVLITGASSGLGRAATERLARAGHVVWAGFRDIDGRNAGPASELRAIAQAEDLKIRLVELDVLSDASVAAAVATVLETDGRIDVLVNNAGRMFAGILETFSAAQLQEQLEVNVVGNFRVTKAVLPSMRANRSGLLLHVSSVFGRISSPFCGLYAASKFALEGMLSALATEVHLLGIDSVLIEPGPFRTNVGSSGAWGADSHLLPEYGAVGAAFQAWGEGFGAFMAQPIPELDPAVFAGEVLALVETPAGQRPARKSAGLDYGINVLNGLSAPFERGMIDGQQLGFLVAERSAT